MLRVLCARAGAPAVRRGVHGSAACLSATLGPRAFPLLPPLTPPPRRVEQQRRLRASRGCGIVRLRWACPTFVPLILPSEAVNGSPFMLKRSTPPAARSQRQVRRKLVPLPQVRKRDDLPTFTLDYFAEVLMTAMGRPRWGVYDMTPFLDAPGSAHRIMMVNGSDLGEFWRVYELPARTSASSLSSIESETSRTRTWPL